MWQQKPTMKMRCMGLCSRVSLSLLRLANIHLVCNCIRQQGLLWPCSLKLAGLLHMQSNAWCCGRMHEPEMI